MPIPTIEETIPRLRELPETIRDFLGADSTTTAIGEIAETYALGPDAVVRLSRDVAFFAMEFLSAKEFIAELQNLAPQGKLAEFRKDVAEKIFLPRARELRDHGIQIETVAAIPTEPPTFAKVIPVRPSPPPPPPKPAPPPISITPPVGAGPSPQPAIRTPFMPPVMPSPATGAPAASPAPVRLPTPVMPTRITITPEQPGIPKPPPVGGPEAPQIGRPSEPKPIRYTLPPVIPEAPKIISVSKPAPPVGGPPITRPVAPPMMPPPPALGVRVEPPRPAPLEGPPKPQEKPGAPVIDLSTFQVSGQTNPILKPAPPPAQNRTEPNEEGPKARGNTIDLKP